MKCLFFCRIIMLIGINFFVVFIFEMVVEKINVYIKYNFLVYFNNIVLVFFLWDIYVFNFEIKCML